MDKYACMNYMSDYATKYTQILQNIDFQIILSLAITTPNNKVKNENLYIKC